MKISFITTVFNEEKTIDKFLDSLLVQTKLPDEIVIVDGGSRDRTLKSIKDKVLSIKGERLKRIGFKILVKTGNRSVGRNEAIKKASGDIIVCSDSGNILDKKWIENIIKPFFSQKSSSRNSKERLDELQLDDLKTSVDVVAGYYTGKSQNIFQKCLVPYVLVMPDKVDPDNFLPATRSVAFTKKIWKKVGGFNEKFSHNEDYVFAHQLKKIGAKIVFAKDAIVYWIPRNTFKEAFIMFFRFAFGDAESGIVRSKVLLLFARYFMAGYFVFLSLLYKSAIPISVVAFSVMFYLIWSIKKNYKYIQKKEAIKVLPLLQLTADAAVLSGTVVGVLKQIKRFNYLFYIKQNKLFFALIFLYSVIILLTLQWGIPNQNHPFTYHMDEWHQSQAVRTTFTQGTPNIEGSANGSLLHFLLSGFYLIPFVAVGIVNPFVIDSSVTSLDMQQRLFEVFRINTVLFGVLSISLFAYIAKRYFKLNAAFAAFLFVFNPLWITLSNYFKYDIALMFWILLGLILLLRFVYNPTFRNYLIAGVACSLSLAVKFSAIPLLAVYALAYLFYFPKPLKNIPKLLVGILVYVGVFICLGIPDLFFGRGDIYEYLDSNLRRSPGLTDNYLFSMPYFSFLLFKLYPYNFGHILYGLFILSGIFCVAWIGKLYLRKGSTAFITTLLTYKAHVLFLIAFVLFFLSLIPLKIEGRANRILVLLPFIVLFGALFLTYLHKKIREQKKRILFILLIILLFTVQLFETFSWVWMKLSIDPRVASSLWLQNNIKSGSVLGIENIPIYQMLPDLVLKEYYNKEYGVQEKNKYKYIIVTSDSATLPPTIIVTNGEVESKYLRQSVKKDLVARLAKEDYQVVAQFTPDFRFYRLYGDDFTFYLASMVIAPNSITIYSKK